MSAMELEKKVREPERRVELTETRLSQAGGQFEFISGQLRDVQLYHLHAKFADLDQRLDGMETGLRREISAIPRAVAEMLAERD